MDLAIIDIIWATLNMSMMMMMMMMRMAVLSFLQLWWLAYCMEIGQPTIHRGLY